MPHHTEIQAAAISNLHSDLPFALRLAAQWRATALFTITCATAALAASYVIPPTYTARTIFIPPAQQQGVGASALASLSALSGLAGVGAGIKSTSDQYVSLMQSANVQNSVINQFQLLEVYDARNHMQARRQLEKHVRISLGKKDGLIYVEADDVDPKRAASIANQHVAELKRLASEFALTEAQQKRKFFEVELKRTHASLIDAQQRLQQSGFSAAAVKAEPKAIADTYAKIRADRTSAEVRLRALKTRLTDSAPEVLQQQEQINALSAELNRLEAAGGAKASSDYLGSYRDFKYQETLFELLSKQYEVARLDEARDSALIQVVDVATPPEQRSAPRRSVYAAIGSTVGFIVFAAFIYIRPLLASRRQRA